MTRSVPTPLFSTLVVGAAWRRLFLEWHLPSLWLADIDVLGASPRFRVYTSRADAGPLFEGIKAFEGLAQFEIIAVDEEALRLVAAGVVPVHHIKKVCQFDALSLAWADDRPVCWTLPDIVYAPGSFRGIKRGVERGARAMVHTGFSIRSDLVFESPELREAVFGIKGSALTWAEPFLPYIHPMSAARFWTARDRRPLRSRWPSVLYADTDAGLFANAFHLNPAYVHPRRLVAIEESKRGFEGDLLELADIAPHEIEALSDGAFQIIELRDPAKLEGLDGADTPMTDEEVARWARTHGTTAFNRRFFPETVPLFLRDGLTPKDAASTMAALSERAKRIVTELDTSI